MAPEISVLFSGGKVSQPICIRGIFGFLVLAHPSPALDYSYLEVEALGQKCVGAPTIHEETVGVVEVLGLAVLTHALQIPGRLCHGGRDCW